MTRVPRRMILWSPAFDDVTGQALVTRRVATQMPGVQWTRAIFPAGRGIKAFGVLGAAAMAWWDVVRHGTRDAYVVCSRSVPGFLRDLPALALTLAGVRVVVHTHGSDLVDLLHHRRVGGLARILYRRCTVIIPSEHLRADLVAAGCRHIHLCENFGQVPAAAFAATPATPPLHVLWNSNLMASKGVRDLVAGIGQARDQGADIRIILIGRPLPDREATAAQIADWTTGLADLPWVDLRGPVPPDEATALLEQTDLVALPSRYKSECQPLAVIQAMLAGKGLLLGDTPALRATAGNYPALFSLSDADSLQRALQQIAAGHGPNAVDLAKAAQIAQIRFSADRFTRQMQEILLTPDTRSATLSPQ